VVERGDRQTAEVGRRQEELPLWGGRVKGLSKNNKGEGKRKEENVG